MPIIQTDDAARRQEFYWLGSPTMPWPFTASGRAWLVGILACPTLMSAAFASTRAVLALVSAPAAAGLVGGLFAVLAGLLAGVLITRRVGRVLSPTRPIVHHLLRLQGELNAPREQAPTTHLTTGVDDLWLDRQERSTHLLTVPDFGDETT